MEDDEIDQKTPTPTAMTRPGKGGIFPPPEHRFKRGNSGNPRGSRPFGETLRGWLNRLGGMNEERLRAIARRAGRSAVKRAAANMLLDAMRRPDLADFEALLNGEDTLKGARAKGLDTAQLKRVKAKRREIPQDGGPPIVETEREIELHDRVLPANEFSTHETSGTPTRTVHIQGDAPPLGPPQIFVRVLGDDPDIIDAEPEPKALPGSAERGAV